MGQKETGGTLVGAGLGAFVGSQIGGGTGQLAAVALGTLTGAYFGSEVGKSLDRADKAAAAQAYNKALTAPIGQHISWSNPESGHSGTVTPLRQGHTQSGEERSEEGRVGAGCVRKCTTWRTPCDTQKKHRKKEE